MPLAEDIVHERFLACVEKGDAHSAMAHFAFISCEARERGTEDAQQRGDAEERRREAGELLTLRRRQLLVLLCEKGMVKEASELLTNAVASPAFDSRDSSTIVSERCQSLVCVISVSCRTGRFFLRTSTEESARRQSLQFGHGGGAVVLYMLLSAAVHHAPGRSHNPIFVYFSLLEV